MPLIARGAGSGDQVTCVSHGLAGVGCRCCVELVLPLTLECSTNVKVGGFGVVRVGDIMMPHKRNLLPIETLCAPHSPPCDEGSPNIFVNGKQVARQYDHYFEGNDHWISKVVGGAVMANGAGGSFVPRASGPGTPPPVIAIPFWAPF